MGIVIDPCRVEMQKENVNGILSWPAPKNVKEVQKFLELANYYRWFIKNFARIAAHYISWLERRKSRDGGKNKQKHSKS